MNEKLNPKIVTTDMEDHHVLREPAKTVTFPLDDQALECINALKIILQQLESPYGKPAGLAATQIGIPLRIFIFQIPPEAKQIRKDVFDIIPPTILINASYAPESNVREKDWEGCYSITNKVGEVIRFATIHCEALTENGECFSRTAKGFLARVLQHEIGHLNGELYIDLLEADCRFGDASRMLEIRRQEREASQK